MTRIWHGALLGATIFVGGACTDLTASSDDADALAEALSASLGTALVGQGSLTTSYIGPEAEFFRDATFPMAGGPGARLERGSFMGGGLDGAFVGDASLGRGFDARGPFGGGVGCRGGAGAFNSATGRVDCPADNRDGLTVTRSIQYLNAAGQAQQAFDTTTTNSVNVRSAVSGTVVFSRGADSAAGRPPGRHRGGHGGPGGFGRLLGDTATLLTATIQVQSQSERTTTGLASGSAARTTNGASRGTESMTGTTSRGAFTATRLAADTTRGLVVARPTEANPRPYPTAGSVIRAMQASLTYAGQSPVAVSRREVVTYDGSATARVTITENGTTRSCTRPLPRGELTCS